MSILFISFISQNCVGLSSAPIPSSAVPDNVLHPITDTPWWNTTSVSLSAPEIATATTPPGVFTLFIYPPLIINYDASEWRLVSKGSLQALSLETCQLVEIGPSGNFPPDTIPIRLGNIEYLFSFSEISTPGMTAGLYIENQSVDGYDYDLGLPVLMILASQSEWDQCKTLGEAVLSTLRIP